MFAEVLSTQVLSPQLIRVVLGGPGLDDFTPIPETDAYVNCFFLPEAAPYAVPFDPEAVRDLPREQRPYPRRYTIRTWDETARELTLDFVVHGDVGYAGRWARHAKPGDRLQLRGPGGGYRPHPDADAYLFVGDESALPAIAAAAEAVPAGKRVRVVAQVEDAGGHIPLDSPGALEVHWVHRSEAGDVDGQLAEAVDALPPLAGVVSAFVHGEALATRLVRRVLLGRDLVARDLLSCSPYWRSGHTDEEWRSIKGDFVRATDAEFSA